MLCPDPRRVLHRYCNAPASADFSSGRSSAAVGYWYQKSSGAKGEIFEENCAGKWCAGPSSRAPQDTRQGPHHRRWNSGGEGWFPRINEAARSGRAGGDCVGGERRAREARRQCGWCLCGAFLA